MSDAGVFSGTKPVDPRLAFDEAALARWMTRHVEGFAGPLSVSQFKGGQSNPTYRLDTPERAYVLRRKPPGNLLPSAHAVDREFRVISALHPTGFPVARPYGLCMDDAVIGSAFYVMEAVDGRIFWEASLPDLTADMRNAVYQAEITTLARLHGLDPAVVGLSDYGKAGNYFARQVERWSRQYRASETTPVAEMDRLIGWLPSTVPAQERVSIVHGDFRLDNMIFAAQAPVVRAVLDWELSTLGDPMADFTYFLMPWILPDMGGGRGGLMGRNLPALGIPTLEETVARYCALTGREGAPALDWYFAYNLFRIAAILQGIAGRVRDGTAVSTQAAQQGERVGLLAAAAWGFAQRAGA